MNQEREAEGRPKSKTVVIAGAGYREKSAQRKQTKGRIFIFSKFNQNL